MNIPSKGTTRHPLVLFQYIKPLMAAHGGASYETRHIEIRTSTTNKYFPPRWHDARIGAHDKK